MLQVGQKVIRYMGVAGGFWQGHVHVVTDETHIRVAFGLRREWDGTESFDFAMPFEVDEYLFVYPETAQELEALRAKIRAQLERDAPLNAALSQPLWPRGYFGDLEKDLGESD